MKRVILIVDDDRDLLSGLGTALAREDRSVILCQDLESAKLLIEAIPVTHVVSDIRLTGPFEFEGLGLVQYVRERSPRTIVILMSGIFSPELELEAQNRGSVALLHKPFSVEDLERAIEQFPVNDRFAIGDDAPDVVLPELIEVPILDDIIESSCLGSVFQPIHRLDDGANAIFGFEALTRLNTESPFRDPALLFRYAADKRRVAELELACLRRACEEGAPLTARGLLFVNIDPAVFSAGKRLTDVVLNAAVPPAKLILEITEQAPLRDEPVVWETIAELRRAGVRFAFDDVGVAYSHFPHIARVEPAFLKISQHFGTSFETDRVSEMIVRSVLQLATNLSRQLILEGIETEATLKAAIDLGIHFGQGYYFAKPAPCGQFLAHFAP